jgi:hypothetical protein
VLRRSSRTAGVRPHARGTRRREERRFFVGREPPLPLRDLSAHQAGVIGDGGAVEIAFACSSVTPPPQCDLLLLSGSANGESGLRRGVSTVATSRRTCGVNPARSLVVVKREDGSIVAFGCTPNTMPIFGPSW